MTIRINEHIKLEEFLGDYYNVYYKGKCLTQNFTCFSKESFSYINGIPVLETQHGNVNLDSDIPLFTLIDDPSSVICFYSFCKYSINSNFVTLIDENRLLKYIDGVYSYLEMGYAMYNSYISYDNTKVICFLDDYDLKYSNFVICDLDGNILFKHKLKVYSKLMLIENHLLYRVRKKLYIIDISTNNIEKIKYGKKLKLISYNDRIILYDKCYFSIKERKYYDYNIKRNIDDYVSIFNDICYLVNNDILVNQYKVRKMLYKFKL